MLENAFSFANVKASPYAPAFICHIPLPSCDQPHKVSDNTGAIASQRSVVRSNAGPQLPVRSHKGLSTAFTHEKGKISIMTCESVRGSFGTAETCFSQSRYNGGI
jgi:hypothetical protein